MLAAFSRKSLKVDILTLSSLLISFCFCLNCNVRIKNQLKKHLFNKRKYANIWLFNYWISKQCFELMGWMNYLLTPARKLNVVLYLLMISSVVGLGRFVMSFSKSPVLLRMNSRFSSEYQMFGISDIFSTKYCKNRLRSSKNFVSLFPLSKVKCIKGDAYTWIIPFVPWLS